MRYGQSPLKTQKTTIERPAMVTIGVLNYIPEQVGYFKGQLDSLKLCLASIRHHADQPVDLLVVDNGSCAEVRSYLHDELVAGHIDYLILNSRNIGKANAVLQILRSAPGDMVFYSDGDIYYRPGWLQAHLDVMKSFPNVGIVGGVPLRNQADFYTAGTYQWVENNKELLQCDSGDLIPEEWTLDFLRSVGATGQQMQNHLADWQQLEDYRITRNGVTAYVGASHMQYLICRQAIEALPHRRFGLALSPEEDHVFDQTLDNAGFLRLSTDRPYVYHIGNSISEAWLAEEFKRLVGQSPTQATIRATPTRHWFWGRWSVRTVVRWIHERTFDLYYQNT